MSEEITIESIQGLQPNRIYFVEVGSSKDFSLLMKAMKKIAKLRKERGLEPTNSFIIGVMKGEKIKFIDIPEGYEIVKIKEDK